MRRTISFPALFSTFIILIISGLNSINAHWHGGGHWHGDWHAGYWHHDNVYVSDPWYHRDHVYFIGGDAYPYYYDGYPYYYYDPRYYWGAPAINVNLNFGD